MTNRPIDKVRTSAGTMTLPPDSGGITDMGEINGALHMIGGSAIYRVQLADEIDPARTNIDIPDTHQKVLSYGTELPYVRQTLMTARRLFSNGVLGASFDYKSGINLSFEALQDLAAMHDICQDLHDRLNKATEAIKNPTVQQRSMTVPSMGNVRGDTKAFLQKADHVAIALFNIAKIFYGNEIGKGMFEGLHDLTRKKFGEDDPFPQFLKAAVPFLKFVRNARNAVEHPDQTKNVKVSDISLLPTGELRPPSIDVIHPETPQSTVPLLALMEHVANHLANSFEAMLAYLCGVNVQPVAGMSLGVIEYDENQQKAYKCRYGYATRIGDQIVPFG